MCLFVGAIVVGAVIGGSINAYQQYQDTGRIDSDQLIGATLTGAVIGGGIVIGASAALAGAAVVASVVGASSLNRAVDLHDTLSAADPIAGAMRTTGVLTTQEGVTLVASSNASLASVQQNALLPGEISVLGQQGVHAEVKLISAAITTGLTPNVMFVSRPVCSACQALLEYFNTPFIEP